MTHLRSPTPITAEYSERPLWVQRFRLPLLLRPPARAAVRVGLKLKALDVRRVEDEHFKRLGRSFTGRGFLREGIHVQFQRRPRRWPEEDGPGGVGQVFPEVATPA